MAPPNKQWGLSIKVDARQLDAISRHTNTLARATLRLQSSTRTLGGSIRTIDNQMEALTANAAARATAFEKNIKTIQRGMEAGANMGGGMGNLGIKLSQNQKKFEEQLRKQFGIHGSAIGANAPKSGRGIFDTGRTLNSRQAITGLLIAHVTKPLQDLKATLNTANNHLVDIKAILRASGGTGGKTVTLDQINKAKLQAEKEAAAAALRESKRRIVPGNRLIEVKSDRPTRGPPLGHELLLSRSIQEIANALNVSNSTAFKQPKFRDATKAERSSLVTAVTTAIGPGKFEGKGFDQGKLKQAIALQIARTVGVGDRGLLTAAIFRQGLAENSKEFARIINRILTSYTANALRSLEETIARLLTRRVVRGGTLPAEGELRGAIGRGIDPASLQIAFGAGAANLTSIVASNLLRNIQDGRSNRPDQSKLLASLTQLRSQRLEEAVDQPGKFRGKTANLLDDPQLQALRGLPSLSPVQINDFKKQYRNLVNLVESIGNAEGRVSGSESGLKTASRFIPSAEDNPRAFAQLIGVARSSGGVLGRATSALKPVLSEGDFKQLGVEIAAANAKIAQGRGPMLEGVREKLDAIASRMQQNIGAISLIGRGVTPQAIAQAQAGGQFITDATSRPVGNRAFQRESLATSLLKSQLSQGDVDDPKKFRSRLDTILKNVLAPVFRSLGEPETAGRFSQGVERFTKRETEQFRQQVLASSDFKQIKQLEEQQLKESKRQTRAQNETTKAVKAQARRREPRGGSAAGLAASGSGAVVASGGGGAVGKVGTIAGTGGGGGAVGSGAGGGGTSFGARGGFGPGLPADERLGGYLQRVAAFGGSAFLIFGFVRQVQNALGVIKDFEEALVSVQQVLNPLGGDIGRLGDEAGVFAERFGQGLVESVQGMQIFAQQGKEMADILRLTEASMLAANVTNLGLTEATEALTAAQKQFQLSTNDTMRILNAWNEVENTTAVTTRVLTEALKNAGSVARVAGVDFDTFNGIVAAIGEATRKSGQSIGTALKFIFQRFRSDQAISALQEVGILVQSQDGQFKSVRNVVAELANKWDSLTDSQKQNVAVNVAGTRRLNDFFILIQRWNRATDISITSQLSQGSAMRENEIVMESLSKRVNQLQASYHSFLVEIGDSGALDALKTVVDLLRGMVNSLKTINTFTSGVTGGAIGAAGIVGGGLATASLFGLIPGAVGHATGFRGGRGGSRRRGLGGSGFPPAGLAAGAAAASPAGPSALGVVPIPFGSDGRVRNESRFGQRFRHARNRGIPQRGLAIGTFLGASFAQGLFEPDEFGSRTKGEIAGSAALTALQFGAIGAALLPGLGSGGKRFRTGKGGLDASKRRPQFDIKQPIRSSAAKGFAAFKRGGITSKSFSVLIAAAIAGEIFRAVQNIRGGGADTEAAGSGVRRLNALEQKLSQTISALKQFGQDEGRGVREANVETFNRLRDSVAALAPELVDFDSAGRVLGNNAEQWAKSLTLVSDRVRKAQIATTELLIARSQEGKEVAKLIKTLAEAQKRLSELPTDIDTNAKTLKRRTEQQAIITEARSGIEGALFQPFSARAIQRGRSGEGLNLSFAQIQRLLKGVDTSSGRFATGQLRDFIQGSGGIDVDVSRQIEAAGATIEDAIDRGLFQQRPGDPLRNIQTGAVVGPGGLEDIERIRKAGGIVIEAFERVAGQIVLPGEDLAKVMKQFTVVVKDLMARNQELIANTRDVNAITLETARVRTPDQAAFTGQGLRAAARSLQTQRQIEETGVQQFNQVFTPVEGPGGLQRTARQMIGELFRLGQEMGGVSLAAFQDINEQIVKFSSVETKRTIESITKGLVVGGGPGGAEGAINFDQAFKRLEGFLDDDVAVVLKEEVRSLREKIGGDPSKFASFKAEFDTTVAEIQAASFKSLAVDQLQRLVGTQFPKQFKETRQDIESGLKAVANDFALRFNIGDVGDVEQFRQSSTLFNKFVDDMQFFTDRTANVRDALKSTIDSLRTNADVPPGLLKNLEGSLQIFNAQVEFLNANAGDVNAVLERVAAAEERRRRNSLALSLAQGGGQFGLTGDTASAFAIETLKSALDKLDETIPENSDAVRALKNAIEEETTKRESLQAVRQQTRANFGTGLANTELARAMGIATEGVTDSILSSVRDPVRELLSQLVKVADFEGQGPDQVLAITTGIKEAFSEPIGIIKSLSDLASGDFTQQRLLASPGIKALSEQIEASLGRGFSQEDILANPFTRAVVAKSPLLQEQLKLATSNTVLARVMEENTNVTRLVNEALRGFPETLARLQGKPLTPEQKAGIPGSFLRGTQGSTGNPDVNALGQIRDNNTPARLDRGEIVLNQADSEAYLRNRFQGGTGATPGGRLRNAQGQFVAKSQAGVPNAAGSGGLLTNAEIQEFENLKRKLGTGNKSPQALNKIVQDIIAKRSGVGGPAKSADRQRLREFARAKRGGDSLLRVQTLEDLAKSLMGQELSGVRSQFSRSFLDKVSAQYDGTNTYSFANEVSKRAKSGITTKGTKLLGQGIRNFRTNSGLLGLTPKQIDNVLSRVKITPADLGTNYAVASTQPIIVKSAGGTNASTAAIDKLRLKFSRKPILALSSIPFNVSGQGSNLVDSLGAILGHEATHLAHQSVLAVPGAGSRQVNQKLTNSLLNAMINNTDDLSRAATARTLFSTGIKSPKGIPIANLGQSLIKSPGLLNGPAGQWVAQEFLAHAVEASLRTNTDLPPNLKAIVPSLFDAAHEINLVTAAGSKVPADVGLQRAQNAQKKIEAVLDGLAGGGQIKPQTTLQLQQAFATKIGKPSKIVPKLKAAGKVGSGLKSSVATLTKAGLKGGEAVIRGTGKAGLAAFAISMLDLATQNEDGEGFLPQNASRGLQSMFNMQTGIQLAEKGSIFGLDWTGKGIARAEGALASKAAAATQSAASATDALAKSKHVNVAREARTRLKILQATTAGRISTAGATQLSRLSAGRTLVTKGGGAALAVLSAAELGAAAGNLGAQGLQHLGVPNYTEDSVKRSEAFLNQVQRPGSELFAGISNLVTGLVPGGDSFDSQFSRMLEQHAIASEHLRIEGISKNAQFQMPNTEKMELFNTFLSRRETQLHDSVIDDLLKSRIGEFVDPERLANLREQIQKDTGHGTRAGSDSSGKGAEAILQQIVDLNRKYHGQASDLETNYEKFLGATYKNETVPAQHLERLSRIGAFKGALEPRIKGMSRALANANEPLISHRARFAYWFNRPDIGESLEEVARFYGVKPEELGSAKHRFRSVQVSLHSFFGGQDEVGLEERIAKIRKDRGFAAMRNSGAFGVFDRNLEEGAAGGAFTSATNALVWDALRASYPESINRMLGDAGLKILSAMSVSTTPSLENADISTLTYPPELQFVSNYALSTKKANSARNQEIKKAREQYAANRLAAVNTNNAKLATSHLDEDVRRRWSLTAQSLHPTNTVTELLSALGVQLNDLGTREGRKALVSGRALRSVQGAAKGSEIERQLQEAADIQGGLAALTSPGQTGPGVADKFLNDIAVGENDSEGWKTFIAARASFNRSSNREGLLKQFNMLGAQVNHFRGKLILGQAITPSQLPGLNAVYDEHVPPLLAWHQSLQDRVSRFRDEDATGLREAYKRLSPELRNRLISQSNFNPGSLSFLTGQDWTELSRNSQVTQDIGTLAAWKHLAAGSLFARQLLGTLPQGRGEARAERLQNETLAAASRFGGGPMPLGIPIQTHGQEVMMGKPAMDSVVTMMQQLRDMLMMGSNPAPAPVDTVGMDMQGLANAGGTQTIQGQIGHGGTINLEAGPALLAALQQVADLVSDQSGGANVVIGQRIPDSLTDSA